MSERDFRRRPLHPAIDETVIATLVDRFYERVRADAVLGPIFNRVIGERWDGHLAKLKDFWSSVTMMSGRYKGTPFQAHQRIAGLTAAHFDRWLMLWRDTARDLLAPDVAAAFIDRAERIANSLQLGLSTRGGLTPRTAGDAGGGTGNR
jgi:hemoglobin